MQALLFSFLSHSPPPPSHTHTHKKKTDDLRLTGTKLVCGEGGCGACTVTLVDRDTAGRVRARPVNACLFPLYAAEGAAVVTVEGLLPGQGRWGLLLPLALSPRAREGLTLLMLAAGGAAVPISQLLRRDRRARRREDDGGHRERSVANEERENLSERAKSKESGFFFVFCFRNVFSFTSPLSFSFAVSLSLFQAPGPRRRRAAGDPRQQERQLLLPPPPPPPPQQPTESERARRARFCFFFFFFLSHTPTFFSLSFSRCCSLCPHLSPRSLESSLPK